MKRIFALLVILFSMPVWAGLPDIVAVVNDHPITRYELESRKKMIVTLNNINVTDAIMENNLNNQILESLIEEEILNQHAEKIGGAISNDEVNEAIRTIEQRNNMPQGGMRTMFKERGLDVSSFRSQIRSELIRSNIMEALSNSVSISQNELDVALVNSKDQDFDVEAWVFTSKNIMPRNLEKMQKLKKNLVSCDKVDSKLYDEFADGEKFDRPLKKLPNRTQSVVLDTKVNSFSPVYREDDRFKMVFVCKKERSASSSDITKFQSFLSNKKASQKAVKFFKDLKSKAYIKIMIPG